MNKRIDTIIEEARKLTPAERDELLVRLHLECDGSDTVQSAQDHEASWRAELDRRVAAADRGEAVFVTHDQMLKELRQRIPIMIVGYGPDAREELLAATLYYLGIFPELATALTDDLDAAVQRILHMPQAWPPVAGSNGCRRCLLARFPFQIVYRVEGETIRIYAFAHQKRKPGYWRQRLVQSE